MRPLILLYHKSMAIECDKVVGIDRGFIMIMNIIWLYEIMPITIEVQ